jgi:hypothetical protein
LLPFVLGLRFDACFLFCLFGVVWSCHVMVLKFVWCRVCDQVPSCIKLSCLFTCGLYLTTTYSEMHGFALTIIATHNVLKFY